MKAFDAPRPRYPSFLEESEGGEVLIQSLIKEEAQALEVLSSRLVELVKTVDEKQRRLTRLKSFISPVTRLPTEILIQIFNTTYSDQYRQPEDSDAQHDETPPLVSSSPSLFLSQVCSRWRSVVLDMPGLWTKIAVSFETLKQANAQVSLAHLFIERTNGEPYYLDVVDRTPAAQTSSRQLRRLLAYHPEMVVQLGLSACPERLGILSTLPRGIFRRLERVSLQVLLGVPGLREGTGVQLERNEEHAAFNDGSVLLSLWGDYPTVWDIAPELTDISISVEDLGRRRGLVKRVDLFLPGLHLPWERMRSLTLGTKFTGTFDMLGLLGRCSRLESLDIFLPHATSLPPIPIHLPVLRKLNLCFSHFSARHLDDLFLPKLEALNLEGSVRGVVFVGEAIVSLLERSGRPKLRHLGLAVLFTHSREILRAAVAAGPSLESLTLRDLRSDLVEGPQVWAGILRGFHAIDGYRRSLGGESGFCPNLSSLSFHIPDATEPHGFLLALQELLWQRGWGQKLVASDSDGTRDFAQPIQKLSLRASFALPGFWNEFVDHCQLQNEELEIVSVSSSLSSSMLKCRNSGERYAWPSI